MCCVMPPASVATTRALRIASRSVVLPWSTWPMIVTTGGRAWRASSGSSNSSGSSSSSAACLIVISRPTSVAISSTSSSLSDCVAVRIWPRPMRILMMFGIETPSACERSRTLTPDSTETGPVCGGAGGRGSRRWLSWRACRCSREGRAPPWSMTTRRRRPPGPPPPRGRSGRVGRLGRHARGVRKPVLRLDLLGLLGFGLGRRPGDVVGPGALERLVGRHAAEARSGQRGVRTALAVGEDGGAAAGEVLGALLAAPEGRLGLRLGELSVALDVDLPAGEARGETGVHALLADRERELVVGGDDGGLAALVVEVDLAHARRRERLRDEPRGLRVPRDDVDLLATELRHDHAHAR